jgi:ribosomal protein L9
MKVILKKDMSNLGVAATSVDVKPGTAATICFRRASRIQRATRT